MCKFLVQVDLCKFLIKFFMSVLRVLEMGDVYDAILCAETIEDITTMLTFLQRLRVQWKQF